MDYSSFQKTNNNDNEEFQKYVDNASSEQLLELFAEQLLIDKGVIENDPFVRLEMRNDLVEQINGAVNNAVIFAMPEEYLDKINALGEQANKDAVLEVIQQSGINIDEVTKNAMEEFRKQYLGEE